jgi:hypothetical protein
LVSWGKKKTYLQIMPSAIWRYPLPYSPSMNFAALHPMEKKILLNTMVKKNKTK